MKNSTDWFKEWFASDFYQIVYKHRDNNDAKNFLELILSKIHIPKNSLILDAACGAGRHLKFLQEIGYTNVFGFDLSLTLLKSAKLNNVQNIICADIRKVFLRSILI
jgi:SAM-dependent methyltransferase